MHSGYAVLLRRLPNVTNQGIGLRDAKFITREVHNNRIKRSTINSSYIAAFLNSELSKSLAIREVTGGTRPALDYKALKSLKIILPPIKIQNDIVTEIENRLAKVAELRSEANGSIEQAKKRVEQILLVEK